jgi:ATP-binding cassette subfamily B protein
VSEKKPRTKGASLLAILARIAPIALTHAPGAFAASTLLAIVHGVSWGVATWAMQVFLDAVTEAAQGKTTVLRAVLALVLLGLATAGQQLLNGVHNFATGAFLDKVRGHIAKLLQAKASRIDPIYYEDPARLDDINKAAEGKNNAVTLFWLGTNIPTFYLPYFLFMGGYLFRLKPILAVSLLLIFVPVALTQLVRSSVTAKLEEKAAPLRREYEYYEKCLCDREYLKETRLLGAVRFFAELYRGALLLLNREKWKADRTAGLAELAARTLTLAGYLGILYLLFAALLAGEITVGAFAAVFASVGTMFEIMEEAVCRHVGSMVKSLATVRNFVSFLELPERGGKDCRLGAGEGISLKGVSFRYPGKDRDSIESLSLEVAPGETIAIVGENGAGKTTLVRLLIGLYLPSSGSVSIGGLDTREVSPASIYSGISGVFQRYQKYKMTAAENVGISDVARESDRELLAAAVRKASFAVDALPNGYETMLSREFDGVDLSGGEWQRVAIARGFFRAHDLIVLDEPTAAIDPIEESRIYAQFAEISRGKTAILVTHRLGSTKIADRIVVMDSGTIVELGTHDELMRHGGRYATMFSAQARWYA